MKTNVRSNTTDPVKIARRVWLHTRYNFLFNWLGGAPFSQTNKETLNTIVGTRDLKIVIKGTREREKWDKRITVANLCFRDWEQW